MLISSNPDSSRDEVAPSPAHSPLGVPLFRAIWIASLCSNFGGLIQSVGASWMMASMNASAQMIALVQASTSLPIMLLALWAGALADNFDRRHVMLASQIFMLIVAGMLAAVTWMGLATPSLLLVSTFLIGCGAALNGPAWQASVGDMVPRRILPEAVAFNSMGFNIARSLGPAVGGVIVAVAGGAAAFLTNAISYLGLIVVLIRWQPERPPKGLPRERVIVAMQAGLRYAWLSPGISVVLARSALFGLGASALPALMPLIARDILRGGPLAYGFLLGGFGLGAIVGALSSRVLRGRLSVDGIVGLASIATAASCLLVSVIPWLPVTVVVLMPAGAGWVLALSTFNVSVQMGSPRWVVARTVALYQMSAFGGITIGSWAFGWLADLRGVQDTLWLASLISFASATAGKILSLSPIGALDLSPRTGWNAPQTAVPVDGRSGPLVIAIEHRVKGDHIAEFLVAMHERRRIRRRDGARQWTLMRDLADPSLWIERYQFATWLDYVRQNERVTLADLEIGERLARLRVEGTEPIIHRRLERSTVVSPDALRDTDAWEMDPRIDPSRSS